LAGIKAINPNIKIFIYIDTIAVSKTLNLVDNPIWTIVDAHENWFMHNNAGNRVINNYWGGWYLMDERSGWRDFYVQQANTLLSSPYVDGIFGDDVLNEIRFTITAGVFSDAVTNAVLTTSDFSSSYLDNWKSDTVDFLNYVKNNMNSGKKFIINSEEYMTNDYLTLTGVDGKMAEGFAAKTDIMNSINGMARDSATGRIFIAETYVPTPTSTPTAKYSYVATLLAMNGDNCYFGYNAAYYYGYEGGANYMPVFVTNLGSPSGSYYQSQGIYMRNFTNGIVLFNPSDNSYNLDLGNNYQLLNGTIVSSLILGSWSGEILLSHV
ncbi:MAG: putative glycoside hydrolase, partial [Acinetobacter calcoaceticus]